MFFDRNNSNIQFKNLNFCATKYKYKYKYNEYKYKYKYKNKYNLEIS